MERLVRDLAGRLLGQTVTKPSIDAEELVLPYAAHAGQESWWGSDWLDNAAVAGHQSGKTVMEPRLVLRDLQRCAPLVYFFGECRYIYAGPTFPLMEQQAFGYFTDLFVEELGLGRFYASGKPKFVFSEEGAQRLFGFVPRRAIVHFAYAHDSNNIESMRAIGAVCDETGQTEFKQQSYKAIDRRLTIARGFNRPGPAREEMWRAWEGAGGRRHEWLFGRRHVASTPYERNWFKHVIYDKALDPRSFAREAQLARRQNGTMEGTYMLHNWPTWITGLTTEKYERSRIDNGKSDSLTPDEFVMFIEGRYAKPTGAVFRGWH